jgi:hypothetical protein
MAFLLNMVEMQLYIKETLKLCIVINVFTDLLAGWFVVWQLDKFILPYRKLIRLDGKAGMIVSGVVDAVSEKTERYYGFDCWVFKVNGHRVFVINNGNISLTVGQCVTVEVVDGIVKEVRP